MYKHVNKAVKIISLKNKIDSVEYLNKLESLVNELATLKVDVKDADCNVNVSELIDRLPIPILVIDKTDSLGMKILDVNKSFVDISGYELKDLNKGLDWEFVGKDRFLSKDDVVSNWAKRSLKEKKEHVSDNEMPFKLKIKNGGYKYFKVRSSVIFDKNIFILNNYTANKYAEEQLKDSKESIELTLKGADLGMWDWDIPSGNIVVNDKMDGNAWL